MATNITSSPMCLMIRPPCSAARRKARFSNCPMKELSSRLCHPVRQGRESHQVDESHRHPEQGPVAHVGLGPALAVDPVAQEMGEDGAQPESPRSSAVLAAPDALLGQEQGVGPAGGQVGLDALDVEGDRRIGHPGQGAADDVQDLVTSRRR